MAGFEFLKVFSPGVLLQGTRSTVLGTLGWVLALMVAGLMGSVALKSDFWIQVTFVIGGSIDFLVYIGAYIYFARTDPAALRSEGFGIRKLEIEHKLLGDSSSGLFEEGEVRQTIEGAAAALDAPKAEDKQ